MINKEASNYLYLLIKRYSERSKQLYALIDMSSTAFIEYISVKDILQELRLLYYKIYAKEYIEE